IDDFREFGIPPMFIADSITCVIAQRLLRMVCTKHRETYKPDGTTLRILGLNPEESGDVELVRGVKHPENFGTGYSGRTGIFEVLRVDDHIREAILHGQSSKELTNVAVGHGLQSLEQSAIKKVLAGVTTVEEMHRVLL
ncbi:MAG: type II/IV secretion system protein, partial [Planctomycetaceae bacterium]